MTYRIKIRTKRKPKFVSEYYYIMKRLGGPYGLQKRAIRGTFLRDVKLAIKSYRKDYLQRKRRTGKYRFRNGVKVRYTIPYLIKVNGYVK